MDEVTRSRKRHPSTARHVRDATPVASSRLMEEAVRVFLALGVTATDLRLRAKPGSVFAELADALDVQPGTPSQTHR